MIGDVKPNPGTADARAAVAWPDAEVAGRLGPELVHGLLFCVPEPQLVILQTLRLFHGRELYMVSGPVNLCTTHHGELSATKQSKSTKNHESVHAWA